MEENQQNKTDPKPGDEAEQALTAWVEQQDARNIVGYFLSVPEFGTTWLNALSKQVVDDFNSAWDGSEQYRDKRRQNYQILTGNLPKKTFPWDGCANVHIPIMLERHLRLTANVYVEIFADREVLMNVEPTGPDDQEPAEILTLHGNWQLKNELTDFTRQQLRGISEFFASGSVYAYSYRDQVKNRNRHDVLNCEELAIPFVWTTSETDMSDVPFKVRIVRKYRNELEAMKRSGEWEQVDTLLEKGPPAWDILETKVRDKAATGEGIVAPEQSKRAPWVLFEYHGWYRMPGEDRERPVCVTVDLHSKSIVKLYIREEEDWRDRMRFDRQTEEFGLFQQQQQEHLMALQQFQQVQAQQEQLRMAMQAPGVLPEDAMAIEQALMNEPLEPPMQPPPPKWLKDGMQGPNPVRRVPIEMFSHGVCFDNPNGTMGLAPGMILADLNRLGDEAANRFYDSATLANIWSLIAPEGLDFGSSTIPMQPGKILRVKNFAGGNIRDAIHELRAAPANPQLMEIMRMAEESADSSVAAPGVLSGEPGKSGETFRGIATRRDAATRQLSQAGLMYLDFLKNIIRNNARLNALFMDEEEMILVGNHFAEARRLTVDPTTGEPLPEITISRDMYRRDYRVTFSADVRFSSQAEKIAQLDEILAMVSQIPPLQSSQALLYGVVAKMLRLRGLQDLIPLLGPPPPVPTQPIGTPPPMPPGMGPPGAEGMPPGGPPGPGGPPPPQPGPPQ